MVNFKYIFSLLGTDRARDNFLQLCKQYYGEHIRQDKILVSSSFIEQAHIILRAMVKEGKQSSPLNKIHFPHFLIFIGELPNNY